MTRGENEVCLWFDAGCAWTWATSRWLVAAAGQRGLRVEWKLLSLAVLDADRELPEHKRERRALGARVLRVLAAAREAGGNDAVAALYTAYGHRVHDLRAPFDRATVVGAIREARLPAWLADALDEDSWDAVVRRDHDAAQAAAGAESGSPVMAYRDVGWFGPVLSPAPSGPEAGAIWDDLTRFITRDEVFEVKRGRTRGPRVA